MDDSLGYFRLTSLFPLASLFAPIPGIRFRGCRRRGPGEVRRVGVRGGGTRRVR